ncbi:MAG: hypothetical protein AAFV45_14275 [Pseudomonadota bacterium]
MSESEFLDRRRFLSAAGAALAAPMTAALGSSRVLAQSTLLSLDPFQSWKQLSQLTAKAIELGISVPRLSNRINVTDQNDFAQLMPAVVEYMISLERASPRADLPAGQVETLLDEADELLRKVHQAERNLPDDRETGMTLSTRPGRPSFDSIKDGYRELFENCRVRDAHASSVKWYMSKILEDDFQPRWYRVAQEVCCPWYFVAIIHAMEASFSFRSHLHNGDSLRRRTVHVPRGRPDVWNPPNDWETSAIVNAG